MTAFKHGDAPSLAAYLGLRRFHVGAVKVVFRQWDRVLGIYPIAPIRLMSSKELLQFCDHLLEFEGLNVQICCLSGGEL